MNAMTIGKLAKAGGVGVETVRYYQRRGLLGTPSRDDGVRRYDADDLHQLRFVRQAQAAGFTLEEIGKLLALDATDDRGAVQAMAEARIVALDQKIGELQAAKSALAELAHDCRSGATGPCPIILAFETQANGHQSLKPILGPAQTITE